jgi:hypothetical protein
MKVSLSTSKNYGFIADISHVPASRGVSVEEVLESLLPCFAKRYAAHARRPNSSSSARGVRIFTRLSAARDSEHATRARPLLPTNDARPINRSCGGLKGRLQWPVKKPFPASVLIFRTIEHPAGE